MKVKIKNESVDVIGHPEYGWMLTTQAAERVLGVKRSVISMNKSNNPDRYRRGVHYVKAADLFDFLLDNGPAIPEYFNLWTREGVLELSKRLMYVRRDFDGIINQIDTYINKSLTN